MLVNDSYAAYADKTDADKVVTGASGATVIKTGYVGVTNSISSVAGRTIAVADHAKVNSTFTVKATYTSIVAANEEVVLTYDGTKTVTGVADTARMVFTFAVPAGVANVTLNSINNVGTYTVAAPTVTDGTNTVTGLKGLTVSAVADKAAAKSGETVTVTVTISGKATGDVTLTVTAPSSWLAASVPVGVVYTNGTKLTVADGTNLGDGVTVKCEFTVTSTMTTTNIALA